MGGGSMFSRRNCKPNMANLKGAVGRQVIEEILSAPPADLTLLKERARQCSESLLAERQDAGKRKP